MHSNFVKRLLKAAWVLELVVAVLILAVTLLELFLLGEGTLSQVLGGSFSADAFFADAMTIVVGIEFVKMLMLHTPRAVTAKMTMVLSTLPEKAEITAAIMSMSTMRSLNCSRKTWSVLFFFPSESLLGPYCSARRQASWADSPSAEAFCASRACCGVFL